MVDGFVPLTDTEPVAEIVPDDPVRRPPSSTSVVTVSDAGLSTMPRTSSRPIVEAVDGPVIASVTPAGTVNDPKNVAAATVTSASTSTDVPTAPHAWSEGPGTAAPRPVRGITERGTGDTDPFHALRRQRLVVEQQRNHKCDHNHRRRNSCPMLPRAVIPALSRYVRWYPVNLMRMR